MWATVAASVVVVLLAPLSAGAGEVDVVAVRAEKDADGTWSFLPTVHHEDEGWEHYAIGWEIVAPDGAVIVRRKLHHPHVDPNTFTRGKRHIVMPDGVTEVVVRAEDNLHGYGGQEQVVDVTMSPTRGRPAPRTAPAGTPDAGAEAPGKE